MSEKTNYLRIERLKFPQRILCKHKSKVRACDVTQKNKWFSTGVQIYEVCLCCGQIKKSEFVRKDVMDLYNWFNIKTFVSDVKRVYVNFNPKHAFLNSKLKGGKK